MAEFSSNLECFKPPFPPLLEMEPNMEMVTNHFPELTFQSFLGFSSDDFLAEIPGILPENFPPGIFHRVESHAQAAAVGPAPRGTGFSGGNDSQENKKRKAVEISSQSSSLNSPPAVSGNWTRRKNDRKRRKRTKINIQIEEEGEKSKEVVHVRARRGQATDSHSLAERVRRGKINERLRCLKDIVPGCYKTMGMAVMLDEIINYVQSLQNQVEFLSMKLTAASTFHDFNSEADDTIDTMQWAKALEDQKVQRVAVTEEEGIPSAHHHRQQHGSFELTFGSYSSLPYNT